MQIINNIQVLRAIAAILVVFFHTIGTANLYGYGNDFFESPFSHVWGASGVDIFFIISGFIMILIQVKKNRSPLSFLKDRVIRIVPLYWFLTLFYFSILFFLPSIFNQKTYNFSELFFSLFFMAEFFSKQPMLYVGWSLEYEMFFYLIFGLSLFFKKIKISIFISILFLFFAVCLGFNNIVFEFIFGMIFAYFWIKKPFKINEYISYMLIAVGFISLVIFCNDKSLRLLTWGLSSLLIFIGFLNIKPINNKLMISLGNASYAIYLVQVFSIPLIYKIILKLNLPDFIFSEYLYILASIIFSIICGYLLHMIIEKPMSKFILNLKLKKI